MVKNLVIALIAGLFAIAANAADVTCMVAADGTVTMSDGSKAADGTCKDADGKEHAVKDGKSS